MSHLPKNHPVRYLIESAATGGKLNASQLDMLTKADLPTGENLDRYRADVDSAARAVARAGAEGDRIGALRIAEERWSALADSMTPEQRAIDTTVTADDQADIEAIVARAMNH